MFTEMVDRPQRNDCATIGTREIGTETAAGQRIIALAAKMPGSPFIGMEMNVRYPVTGLLSRFTCPWRPDDTVWTEQERKRMLQDVNVSRDAGDARSQEDPP